MRITYQSGSDRRGNPIYETVPATEEGVQILKTSESVTVWPTVEEATQLDAFCADLMAEYGYKVSEPQGKRFPQGKRLARTPRLSVADARKAFLPIKA